MITPATAQEANGPNLRESNKQAKRLDQNPKKDAGVMIYVGDEVVRDYRPRPALVTESHVLLKSKFPAIDVHCHWGLDLDPAQLLKAMDERGVRSIVNLSGGWGQKLDKMLDKFHKFHKFRPNRFIIFCNPDLSGIDAADFGPKTAELIEAAAAKGAAGVKIFKSLGLRLKDSTGHIVAVDDPRLEPIWAKAGQLHMPVLIHTADPAAFFQPIDRFNERWMQLKRRPNWSFYGPAFPGKEALLAQRDRVIERHPETIFIGAHVGGSAENLKSISSLLAKYPNFYVDISGRVAELGRQPYSSRRFFIEFQDRILFGTDRFPGKPEQPRYHIYYRFLETEDEYFDYYDHPFPPTGEWKIYGVHLPDVVLKKIYYQNAERIFAMRN